MLERFFVMLHDGTTEPIGSYATHGQAMGAADDKYMEDGFLWLHSETGLREWIAQSQALLNA